MTLKDEAVILHEIFISLMDAGFTENQAVKIIGVMLSNASDQQQE